MKHDKKNLPHPPPPGEISEEMMLMKEAFISGGRCSAKAFKVSNTCRKLTHGDRLQMLGCLEISRALEISSSNYATMYRPLQIFYYTVTAAYPQ